MYNVDYILYGIKYTSIIKCGFSPKCTKCPNFCKLNNRMYNLTI